MMFEHGRNRESMTLHTPSARRQYFLRKVKQHRRLDQNPWFIFRLFHEVENQGAIIKRMEEMIREQLPTVKVRRSGAKLMISSGKKCAMYNLLDPIAADAIRSVAADTSKSRQKAAQDHRPERRFKQTVQATPATAALAAIEIRDDDATSLAFRIASTTPGWLADLPELAEELAFGRRVPAFA